MDWTSVITSKLARESDIHPHSPVEQAHLFSAFESGSVELEVMDFLFGIVRLFKPIHIIETGTHFGISALALGVACRANGFGKVLSIEMDMEKVKNATKLVENSRLQEYVQIVQGNSLDVISQLPANCAKFDFAFLDSITPDRPREFELLYSKGLLKKLVAFHDTSRTREQSLKNPAEPQSPYCSSLDQIEKLYCRGGIENNLSRGFRLMQLKD